MPTATFPLDQAAQWGRDLGPPSTRGSSKGALILEAHAVFRALAGGATIADVRNACLSGQLLHHAARFTRSRVWDALHWRYFAWDPPRWVLADLAEAARGDASDPRFVGLLYVHHARRDRLVFDFVTDMLWTRWRERRPPLQRGDVLDFLGSVEERADASTRWRESTRKKLAGNILSALRDFGLLKGVQKKALQRPMVPPDVALHVCRLLAREGLQSRALLDAADWRLFLWDSSDTASALSALAQRGEIRFERSGRTVILEVPEAPPEEGP